MSTCFYDTNILLESPEVICGKPFYISNITINELENIKVSATKDETIKYKARQVLHKLEENQENYKVFVYEERNLAELKKKLDVPDSADSRIISCAFALEDVVFHTNDLSCATIARVAGLPVEYHNNKAVDDGYTGYKEVSLSDEELADFYVNVCINHINKYELVDNQYLFIKSNASDEILDKYKWKDGKYVTLPFRTIKSEFFGEYKPRDPYQVAAVDALVSNKITMLRGAAGTSKSLSSFCYMFSLLEKGKIDKIIIFCNTVATRGAAKLGFYKGTKDEKLLDSQIGNLLESKLGDKLIVDKMVADGELVLLPMSDIRGYDTTGMNAAIYISEAQNMDIELMRLALQRIGDDCICIIDGDDDTQLDLSMYAGSNNGMKRVSQVFRGQEFYGEVKLKNIYRSKIARLAQEL